MGKVAFLLNGQGAQFPGMGRSLYKNSSVKRLYDMAESKRKGTIHQCFEGTGEELTKTENAQPCLFVTDLACAYSLIENGIKPDGVAGFSLGEIAALPLAGVTSVSESFELVKKRGELMQRDAEKTEGTMVAVLTKDKKKLRKLAKEFKVYPVNYNCPGQIVVSGKKKRIEKFIMELEKQEFKYKKLQVSGAFHTPYMESASKELYKYLEGVKVHRPKISIYGNYTAKPYEADHAVIRNNIAKQIVNPVRFEETMQQMYEDGYDTFIECGPGKTLSGFVRRTLKGVTLCNVSDEESLNKALELLKNK